MGDVVKFTGATILPLPVADVCEEAKGLDYVLILGLDKDGHFVVSCSEADIYKATYLANQFIHKEHNGDYEGE